MPVNCGYGRSRSDRASRGRVQRLPRHQPGERVREGHVQVVRRAAHARDPLVVLRLRHLVDRPADAELAHLVADVREVEADIPRKLDIDARHPLVGVGDFVVTIRNREARADVGLQPQLAGARLQESRGERRGPRRARRDVVGRRREERRGSRKVREVHAALAAARQPQEGTSVVAPRDQPVVHLVGEPDARLDVVPVALVRRVRAAMVGEHQPAFELQRLSGRGVDRAGRQLRLQRVDRRLVEGRDRQVVLHRDRRLVVPPQADVQRRACAELPVVLHEERVVAGTARCGGCRSGRCRLLGSPSRNDAMPLPDVAPVALSGSRRVKVAVEVERPVGRELVAAVEVVGADLAPELREVPAHRLRDRAVERERVVVPSVRRPGEHGLTGDEAADLDERRAGQLERPLEGELRIDVSVDLVVGLLEPVERQPRVPERGRRSA